MLRLQHILHYSSMKENKIFSETLNTLLAYRERNELEDNIQSGVKIPKKKNENGDEVKS